VQAWSQLIIYIICIFHRYTGIRSLYQIAAIIGKQQSATSYHFPILPSTLSSNSQISAGLSRLLFLVLEARALALLLDGVVADQLLVIDVSTKMAGLMKLVSCPLL
jgi:hypothetical protein